MQSSLKMEVEAGRIHQLPPVIADFSGREFELEELAAVQTGGRSRVIGLQGAGGVGKTTLAIRFAHHAAKSYPESQIYLDLKGASAQPLPVAEAQGQVIRAYLPEARLPEHEMELNRLYQSVLSGRRAVLLLDNAANLQQVTPLLPPDGWLTILTSRQNIPISGIFVKHLAVLTGEESSELLERLAPSITRGEAMRIAELCGNLPLAIRVVAGTLRQHPKISISDFAVRLAARQIRGGFVEGVLLNSYELLPPGLQQMWRFLTPFQGTFDLPAAASVWRINPQLAAETLRQFESYCLLEPNSLTHRYRIHDLMLQFIDQRLTGEERRIAKHRFSSHYQSLLHEADALYEQGGHWLKQGVELLDLEWENIHAAQVWSTRHAGDDRAACELCNSFPDAGKYVLNLRQHPRERIRWNEAALEASRTLNRRKATGRHLIGLGDSYTDLSEIHHAIDCYDQALQLAVQIRDRRGEADARSGLGRAHYLVGELDLARRFHEEALEIAYQIGDQRVEAVVLGHLGLTNFAQGQVKMAQRFFEQQLTLAIDRGDRRNESVACGGVGMAHLALGEVGPALESLNRQLLIAREIGDRRGQANALAYLGQVMADKHDYATALEMLEESLAIAHDLADRRSEAVALSGLGLVYFRQRDEVIARQFFDRQLNMARMIGDRRGESQALLSLSEIAAFGHDYRLAGELAQQAMLIASGLGDRLGLGTAHLRLAMAHAGLGERKKALSHAERARLSLAQTELPIIAEVERLMGEWGAA